MFLNVHGTHEKIYGFWPFGGDAFFVQKCQIRCQISTFGDRTVLWQNVHIVTCRFLVILTILGSFWGQFGVILGSWGSILGSWHFDPFLRPWDCDILHFRTFLSNACFCMIWPSVLGSYFHEISVFGHFDHFWWFSWFFRHFSTFFGIFRVFGVKISEFFSHRRVFSKMPSLEGAESTFSHFFSLFARFLSVILGSWSRFLRVF